VVARLGVRLAEDGASARLDGAMKTGTNRVSSAVLDACLPTGQKIPFQHNHFSLMVHTGAKGSAVNLGQIACLLGPSACRRCRRDGTHDAAIAGA
jgi:DNA-directed RNA polymerase I subunit RPA1